MTKKHYEAIAESISYRMSMQYPADHAQYGVTTLRLLAKELADYFASDNPKFDRTRFLDACGIDNTPIMGDFDENGDMRY